MPGRRTLLLAPIVVGLLLAALIVALEVPRRSAEVQTYRIPPGTADKVAQGLPIWQVLPQRLSTVVGEELVVRNEDTTSHVFGPFVLAPGQSWSQRFAMSGDYEMTCSLYPTVDLVIEVSPSIARQPLSRAVSALWALGFVALSVGLVGLVGATLIAPWTDDTSPRAEGVGGAWHAAHALAALLPGAALSLVVLQVVSLSRVAPWRNAVASKALLSWMVMLALASLTFALVLLADEHPRIARYLQLMAVLITGLVVAVATWPWLGSLALSAGLLGAGIGLLGAASWMAWRRDRARAPTPDLPNGGATVQPASTLRTAIAGGLLVLAGVPTPESSVTWLAARGVAVFLVGVVACWWSSRESHDVTWGALWLSRGACIVAAVMGAGLLLWSWLAFVDATSVPLVGNTVPADPASVTRGQALYGTHCTPCHVRAPVVAELTDQQLLEYATWRDADHRFAFDLDQTARGDVVNYMRFTEAIPGAGDAGPGDG